MSIKERSKSGPISLRSLERGDQTSGAAPGESRRVRPLSRSVRKRAAALLHQQCWCWGQDIRRKEGNALVQYGFTRHPPPPGVPANSAYLLRGDDGWNVALWGFGFFFGVGTSGGLFLSRYDFAPKLTAAAALPGPLWTLEQLPPLRLPATPAERASLRRLLPAALRWIGSYEQWALETFGTEYRQRCLESFPHTVAHPDKALAEWERLAARFEAALDETEEAI